LKINYLTVYIGYLRIKLILAYQEGPKMSLALNKPQEIALQFKSSTSSKHEPQVETKE
jgi:hypothetical protein